MFMVPVTSMFSRTERKPAALVPYNDVRFVWISNHYDVHLHGTCIHNGKLCEFENDFPDFFNEAEDMIVRIYSLSLFQRIRWKLRQKLFEICVGYHWTYGKDGCHRSFRIRNRLHRHLFNLYYRAHRRKASKGRAKS